MGMLKISGIIALIGGVISIIAVFLPAIYYYESMAGAGYGVNYSAEVSAFYWFFGFYYVSMKASAEGYGVEVSYEDTFSGFAIDPIGIACAILLIVGCILGAIMGYSVMKERIAPKMGGGILLIIGLLIIIFVALFIAVPRDITIVYDGYSSTGSLLTAFDSIGPGVIFGFIGGSLILIGGIIALVAKS